MSDFIDEIKRRASEAMGIDVGRPVVCFGGPLHRRPPPEWVQLAGVAPRSFEVPGMAAELFVDGLRYECTSAEIGPMRLSARRHTYSLCRFVLEAEGHRTTHWVYLDLTASPDVLETSMFEFYGFA